MPANYVPSKITDINGLQTAISRRAYQQPNISPSIYSPLFKDTTGFANLSGGNFAIASGGGLVAAVNGTQATGYVNLPKAIDMTKPFRFGCLIQFNGDVTNQANIEIQNPNDTSYGQISYNVGSSISVTFLGNTAFSLSSGLTTGQKFWFYMASVGNGLVNFGHVPFNEGGVVGFPSAGDPVNQHVIKTVSPQATNGSHVQFGANMSRIRISNSSSTTVILGMYYVQNSIVGAPNPLLQPPCTVSLNIAGDNTATLRIPGSYNLNSTTDLIIQNHGNNSDSNVGTRTIDPDAGAAFAAVANAGYVMAWMQGTDDNGIVVTTTSAVTASATSVPVLALQSPVQAGTALTFNSAIVTLTQTAFIGATTLNVSATWAGTGNIVSGATFTTSSPNHYSGAQSSNWGATGALQRYWLPFITAIRTYLPTLRNTYYIGQSMGCLNALNQVMMNPGYIKAVVGISGVTNMTDCYNVTNPGIFAPLINAAYPTFYVCVGAGTGQSLGNGGFWSNASTVGDVIPDALRVAPYAFKGAYNAATAYAVNDVIYSNATAMTQVADHDPNLKPSSFLGVPILLFQGAADATISPTANAPLFATRVNAAGGSVTVVNVAGADHLVAAVYNGASIISFLQANQ